MKKFWSWYYESVKNDLPVPDTTQMKALKDATSLEIL
jgi:hypothetical protein